MRSRAFIDRCTITIPVLSKHWSIADDKLSVLFQTDSRFTELAIGNVSLRMKIYLVSVRFSLHDTRLNRGFYIEALPLIGGVNYMRIDWNPRNASKSDLLELLRVLSLNIPEFAGAIRQAMLTRVDIAFDISLPITSFYILTKSAATQTKKFMQTNGVDNYYLGGAKSPHKMVCYDKNIERYGGNMLRTSAGILRILRHKTRCELRLSRAGKISEITEFRNELKRYIFSDNQKIRTIRGSWKWNRFIERCAAIGAQLALRIDLSQKDRSLYRRIMKSCEPNWYCENTIWAEAMSQLLTIFDEQILLMPEPAPALRFLAI